MQMHNYEIKGFVEFLLKMENVKPKLSRMRVRFAKIAQAQLGLIEEERIDLAKRFAKRDGNGDIITSTDSEGNETFELSDVLGFQVAFSELLEEEFHVEQNQENKDMLISIKELILETEMLIGGGQEAIAYDRWCEIVEGVNY